MSRLLFLLLFTLAVSGLPAQIVLFQEAENCQTARTQGKHRVYDSKFATGQKYVGDFGESAGDRNLWRFSLPAETASPRLAIRYAFDHGSIVRRGRQPEKSRNFLVTVDRRVTATVHLPDTGHWEDFVTVYLPLPSMMAGLHEITVSAPSPDMAMNLDCYVLFRGVPETLFTAPFRHTVVGKQETPPIVIKMTPNCAVRWRPDELLRDFTKIHAWFHETMGWKPDRPVINVHIYEDPLMTGPAHENLAGVHFQASNANWDKGNWVHEMNHVFDNGFFPGWIGHPLIRTNDAFDSCDTIFPDLGSPGRENNERYRRERTAQAARLLNNPAATTDDPHEVIYALRVKYGKDLLPGFYRAAKQASDRGERPLKRGNPLTREEIARYMSEAAGEDVRPMFRRWTGWDRER